MTESNFILGAVADGLRDYLDANGLPAPQVRESLAPYSASQRLPMSLFRQQLERIALIQPVPAVGLRIGRQVNPEHFGVVGYLTASCDSLGQALRRYDRFQTLLISDLRIETRREADRLRMSWRHGGSGDSLLVSEFGVAAFVSLMQALIGRTDPPLRVELPHPPPRQHRFYEALLGCPVQFQAAAIALEIPLGLLARRIQTSDPSLRKLFDRQAQAMLLESPATDSFLDRLQHHLQEALQEGEPAAADVARRMHLSTRSFYRQLARQGLRYRALVAETRFKLARFYLADPRLSLAEIALLLGYSEQSAFTRAFRAWTGSTPSEYR